MISLRIEDDMLDRFQKKFIRNKVKEIGDVGQIETLYNKDDEVSKYALGLVEKGGIKKTKGKVYYRIKEYKEVAIDKPEVFTEYNEATQKVRIKNKKNPGMLFLVFRCTKKGKEYV
jgi:hypothetical protein